jgi:hypothetical protein
MSYLACAEAPQVDGTVEAAGGISGSWAVGRCGGTNQVGVVVGSELGAFDTHGDIMS